MAKLNLTVDEVLTTTRAVRKRLDFDRPVEYEAIRECLDIAVQSPTGSMGQFWQFILVDDPAVRAKLGDIYRRAWDLYVNEPYSIFNLHKDDHDMAAVAAPAAASAAYLGENMGRAPWLMVAVLAGRYEDAPPALVAGFIRIDPASGVEFHARGARAIARHVLDNRAPHVRRRSRRRPRHPVR